MLLSFPLNKRFIRETQLLLSVNALRLYFMLNWERKYPRRRIKQRVQLLEKAKRFAGMWVDDQEISVWLSIDLAEVDSIRRELIEHNLINYSPITGNKMDRSLIGNYVIRKMR